MTVTSDISNIRHQISDYLDKLSPERLQSVADYLAYLVDKESEEATQELLEIPGLLKLVEEGKKSIDEGKVTPVEKLKRKY